jgi:CRISPR-associated protein Cmr6
VLHEIVPLGKTYKDMVAAAVARQKKEAERVGAFAATATAAAPFTTGLGIEHPLENGFAFLDPYGLPYLPGSGVKGVVRRAAEELALFEAEAHGWSIPAVWWLFGFDATSAFLAGDGKGDPKVIAEEREAWRNAYRQHLERLDGEGKRLLDAFCRAASPRGKEGAEQVLAALRGEGGRELLNHLHLRGALEFWDVIPEPADGKLRVDIMNPHYNHYYQEGKAPGDWGSPVPIYFLTLPPGSTFTFVVRFRPPVQWPEEVRASLEPRWRGLVEAALHFAWEWQGFGAKTAVGYGRMGTRDVKPLPPLQFPKDPGGA